MDSATDETKTGVALGIGAGALWGLVFLAPALAWAFPPLQLAIGRYLFYGLFSAALVQPSWRQLRRKLDARDGWMLAWLSLSGNILYYVLLASAVQMGGIAMTSLVIGFLPVTVTVVGSRDRGAVPLRRLLPSLLMCSIGVACIGWHALTAAPADAAHPAAGLACAIGALVAWTCFAVGNSRWLVRRPQLTAHEWNLLTGLTTGALSLLLVPLAVLLRPATPPTQSWAVLLAVSAGVALLASILGNALWNRMSQLLPLTLVGQMILFETLFALMYGFVWEQRLPALAEVIAFALVVASVVSCVAAHRTRAPAPPASVG